MMWAAGVLGGLFAVLVVLAFSRSSVDGVGFAGGLQSVSNKYDSDQAHYYAKRRSDENIESPPRHFPLGFKIALATPLFAVGFWVGLAALAARDNTGRLVILRIFVLLAGGVICVVALFLPFS